MVGASKQTLEQLGSEGNKRELNHCAVLWAMVRTWVFTLREDEKSLEGCELSICVLGRRVTLAAVLRTDPR